SVVNREVSAKRLQLLKEIAPHATRVAVLWNVTKLILGDPLTVSHRRQVVDLVAVLLQEWPVICYNEPDHINSRSPEAHDE
ncbi:MAG: hypothetical protein M3361_02920, partial [Candidatus Tectomicrobia bacterium]|nr:hypothetical protein [Candidatus Tectomicrobia bacterium]